MTNTPKLAPLKPVKPTPPEPPKTKFGRWMHENGISVDAVAEALRCSRTYVYSLIAGEVDVRLSTARACRELSGGKVEIDSWPDLRGGRQ